MITPDTSAVIAAFASWHKDHDLVARAIEGAADLVAHVELEVYSVLTRMPNPHRADKDLVRDYLSARFPGERFQPPDIEHRALVSTLCTAGIDGGAVYDGLIGLIAKAHGAVLVTCDRRAMGTYSALGVRATLLAG